MKKTLVLMDVQNEYIAEGRPFCIESIRPSLGNCAKVLHAAREQGWRIIHVRHIQEGKIFSQENQFSDFIEGFEPVDNETMITKSNFSAFSTDDFELALEDKSSPVYIAGYGSTMCCLSTIIEGYHKGYACHFIYDASAAKKKGYDEVTTHEYATDSISTFSKLITTDEFISAV